MAAASNLRRVKNEFQRSVKVFCSLSYIIHANSSKMRPKLKQETRLTTILIEKNDEPCHPSCVNADKLHVAQRVLFPSLVGYYSLSVFRHR